MESHRSPEQYDDADDMLALERFRHGLCPHCGVKCYDIESADVEEPGLHNMRKPLTIENLVEDGRCLGCQGPVPDHDSSTCDDEEEEDEYANDDHLYLDDCEDPNAFCEETEPSAMASFLDSQGKGREREREFEDCESLMSASYFSAAVSVVSNGSGAYSYRSAPKSRVSTGRKKISMLQRPSSSVLSDNRSMVSDDETNTSFLGGQEPSATVSKCMKELCRNPPVSEKRCFQVLSYLYNVTNKDVENRVAAMSLGAAMAMSNCMSNYRGSVRVQVKACTLLGILADDNPRHQEMIYKAGGISNLTATMMTYRRGQKLLQQEATKALDIVTALPQNAAQFAMNQGVKLIQSIMCNYLSDQSIQERSLGVLHNVAKVQLESVATAELIEAIVVTLGRHKKAKRVHINGCALFRILAQQGSQTVRNSMIWCDVVPHIIKCMKNNLTSSQVQVEGCQTLAALCCDRREARLSVAEEGLSTLLEAMRKHDANLEVQRAACEVLVYVSDGSTASFVRKALSKSAAKKTLERTRKSYEAQCGNLINQVLVSCSR